MALSALAIYKGGTTLLKAKGTFERFAENTTEKFKAARDELFHEWIAETSGRLEDHIAKSREKFVEHGGTLDEHDRKIEEILEQQETQMLAALYAEASYKEVLRERRRMLSFAAVSIANLELTIEQKATVERVLRTLDPVDVLELHRLSRAVGRVERLGNGKGIQHPSTEALRHALLARSNSDDNLTATRCVRETVEVLGGGAGIAAAGQEVAHVTERGELILRVLEKYIDEKHDAFVGAGREEIPGSRSEVDARKLLAAISGLQPALREALKSLKAVERYARPSFRPAHAMVRGDRSLVEPEPTGKSTLHLPAVPLEHAQRVTQPTDGEITVTLQELPHYGRPATNVEVTGPFDVLRWLADDLDARWYTTG